MTCMSKTLSLFAFSSFFASSSFYSLSLLISPPKSLPVSVSFCIKYAWSWEYLSPLTFLVLPAIGAYGLPSVVFLPWVCVGVGDCFINCLTCCLRLSFCCIIWLIDILRSISYDFLIRLRHIDCDSSCVSMKTSKDLDVKEKSAS